jgi:ribosomal protein S3AE
VAEKAVVKKKKKKFVPLLAPEQFGGKVLGECPVYETPSVMGRSITMNYMVLTGDMKKQHLNIQFKVRDIKDGKAMTEVVRYSMIPSLLKRFVRKGRVKIDDSFVVVTKDNRYVRLKPMLITNARTHSSVVTNLRVTAKKLMQNVIANYSYNQFVDEVLSYRLQKFIRDNLHKTYPLKICEIRDFHVLDKKPLNFSFEPTDIQRIIQDSRSAKKNKPEREKKGKKGEQEGEEPESGEEEDVSEEETVQEE